MYADSCSNERSIIYAFAALLGERVLAVSRGSFIGLPVEKFTGFTTSSELASKALRSLASLDISFMSNQRMIAQFDDKWDGRPATIKIILVDGVRIHSYHQGVGAQLLDFRNVSDPTHDITIELLKKYLEERDERRRALHPQQSSLASA